jgi:hypothetical protein
MKINYSLARGSAPNPFSIPHPLQTSPVAPCKKGAMGRLIIPHGKCCLIFNVIKSSITCPLAGLSPLAYSVISGSVLPH